MKYFAYQHLPEHLQEVSKPIGDLATLMDESLPDGAEKSEAFASCSKLKMRWYVPSWVKSLQKIFAEGLR
ncbi:hypothetical protein [Enterobacter sp. RHBSTW-00901]|uniref:hypothetical protein n=1 Tax=Enterobacter sp. RHBSTW-00901 TaxID=2742669 RepID=UPI0020183CC5|nr:hypothetical protein [Enterobacter sp. RHBSTW-00901]